MYRAVKARQKLPGALCPPPSGLKQNMRILIIRTWQASCCVFGMPGVPQALIVATSLPGTAVASRARSDAFARLLDTETPTDAPDSTEASPGQTNASAPARTPSNRLASLLKPDAPSPQITTAPKPNPPDRTQVKPSTRAKHELKANGKKPQTDQPSVTTATQPELSPIAATPIAEARPSWAASTTSTRAAPEDIGAVQVRAGHASDGDTACRRAASEPGCCQVRTTGTVCNGAAVGCVSGGFTCSARDHHRATPAHRAGGPRARAGGENRGGGPDLSPLPHNSAGDAGSRPGSHRSHPRDCGYCAPHQSAAPDNPPHAARTREAGGSHRSADGCTRTGRDQGRACPYARSALAGSTEIAAGAGPGWCPRAATIGPDAQRQRRGSNGSNADRRAASASRPEPDASDADATGNEPAYAPRWVQSALDITA